MRIAGFLFFAFVVAIAAACGEAEKERTPLETLQKYAEAAKNKDITQMKLLLSAATLKLHTEQAKTQGVTLDEIVQRETFFPIDQRVFSYRNEKTEGDKATVEVKNNFGSWDQIFLVKENGSWKIDKKGTAQQMIDQSDADVQDLDAQIEAERKKTEELLDQEEGKPGTSPSASPIDEPAPSGTVTQDPGTDFPGSPPIGAPTKQP
ncbi:MAG: DUF4878 domain-containing protein [Acidobacteriota bacterium]|nr:DUF4878 domain-containing protein [Acidobacteriota bacterium]